MHMYYEYECDDNNYRKYWISYRVNAFDPCPRFLFFNSQELFIQIHSMSEVNERDCERVKMRGRRQRARDSWRFAIVGCLANVNVNDWKFNALNIYSGRIEPSSSAVAFLFSRFQTANEWTVQESF